MISTNYSDLRYLTNVWYSSFNPAVLYFSDVCKHGDFEVVLKMYSFDLRSGETKNRKAINMPLGTAGFWQQLYLRA